MKKVIHFPLPVSKKKEGLAWFMWTIAHSPRLKRKGNGCYNVTYTVCCVCVCVTHCVIEITLKIDE